MKFILATIGLMGAVHLVRMAAGAPAMGAQVATPNVVASNVAQGAAIVSGFLHLSLAVKRLHDIGRSGWWAAWPVALLAVVILAILAPGPVHTWLTGTSAVEVAVAALAILVIFGALMLIYMLILLLTPGELRVNDYGWPDPPPDDSKEAFVSSTVAPADADDFATPVPQPHGPSRYAPAAPVFGRKGARS